MRKIVALLFVLSVQPAHGDTKAAAPAEKPKAAPAIERLAEQDLLAMQNLNLQVQLAMSRVYIKYKLDPADQVNWETGVVTRATKKADKK